jgi:hypothetical protein
MASKPLLKITLQSFFVASMVTALCLLFLNIPLTRQIGLAARYDLFIPLALLLILNALILNIPGRVGQLLAPIYIMVVFALPLSGLWASGTSEQYLMAGTLPNSDSMLYYIDALRFLDGGTVSQSSADKPFISSLLSGLLALTHYNWIHTLILMLVLVILAVYLATRELQRTHGTTAASIFLIIIFLFYRRFSGTAMAENLGLCIGLLAFVLLWRYALPTPAGSQRRAGWLVAGMGTLTLALFARLGAFLILPTLLAWVVWDTFRTSGRKWNWQTWRTPILILLAMLLVVGINRLIINLIGGPDAIASTQFPTHLYSLVTGGQFWSALETEHPELAQLTGNAYVIKTLQICLSAFLQHPMGLLEGIARNYSTYFSDPMRGEYSYIDGASDLINQAARLACFLLAGAGLGTLFLRRNRPISWMVGLCFAGMFLSVPFVPPISTYKLRLMAATLWIQALLPALAAAWLVSLLPGWVKRWQQRLPALSQHSAWPAAIFSLLLLLALTLSPLLIRLTAHPTPLPQLVCPSEQKPIVMRVEPGTYVELVNQYDPRQGWQPYIRLAYFKLKIHNIGEMTQFPIFEAIDQPTVLMEGMDLLTQAEILIFAPAELYSQKPGVILACGNFLKDPPPYTGDFFFAQSLQELNIP